MATATAATMAAATEMAAATVTATATTHADAAMDIKDATTGTKDATTDTKDVDADVDAAKDVNAQEQQHNRESISGPTTTAPSHDGTECNYKDEGHIDGATYGNRQGGSNYLCNGAGS